MLYFIKGTVIGFFLAAPVGPIGVLCIQRTLSRGMAAGFIFGLGTALADTVYCIVAVFGLTVVAGFISDNQVYLTLTGSMAMVYLGFRTLVARPARKATLAVGGGLLSSFVSAFFLAMTNPLIMLLFAAIIAGMRIGISKNYFTAAYLLAFGVFVGSAAAWLALAALVSNLRAKFCPEQLQRLTRLSGVIIIGVGVVCLSSIIIK